MYDDIEEKETLRMLDNPKSLPRDQWDKGSPNILTSRIAIGREMGISPERVRQIEERALDKLAAYLLIEKGLLEQVLTDMGQCNNIVNNTERAL